MDTVSTRRGRSPEEPTAALRIMRFMPITLTVPMRIEPRMSEGATETRAGRRVVVGGTVKSGGFGARLTYRQAAPGAVAPTEEVTSERIALLNDRTLTLPHRVVDRTSSGAVPDLWIQFLEGSGAPLSAASRLGRCDQGPFDLSPELKLGLSVHAAILKTTSFDPYANPMLSFAGEVCIRNGIVARFTLAGSEGPAPAGNEATSSAEVSLFPSGTEVQLPRRMLRGPLGRDSWIFLTFLDGTGQPTGGESLLGKAQPGADTAPIAANDLDGRGAYEDRGGR
jgi:hypothetical protein